MRQSRIFMVFALFVGMSAFVSCQAEEESGMRTRPTDSDEADASDSDNDTDTADEDGGTESDSDNDTETDSDNDVVEDPETGVEVDEDYMEVTVVVPAGASSVIHRDGEDWDSECKISTEDENTDLRCVIEAVELDLYASGDTFMINYNIPEGLCDYFRVRPYFFYQYLAGAGPSYIYMTTTDDVSVVNDNDVVKSVDRITAALDDDGSLVCHDSDNEIEDSDICCEGDYTLREREIDTTDVTDETSDSSSAWAGSRFDCLAGPAVTDMVDDPALMDNNGKPMAMIIDMEGIGLNRDYEIDQPATLGYGTNLYIANYFDISSTFADDEPGAAEDWDTVPLAIRGQESDETEEDGGYYAGNPWYDFGCLDHGNDYIHRIRVLIRSWSTEAEYEAGVEGDYNLGGTEDYFTQYPMLDRYGWFTAPNWDLMTLYPSDGL